MYVDIEKKIPHLQIYITIPMNCNIDDDDDDDNGVLKMAMEPFF